ncbi:MAG: ParA family protein [Myxococcales bacterium]|nr:ParA family protein [Myxococcales bacterium]
MARIIAVSNQKGGVGKTTTTLNLGAALALAGHRVLLIDLDPQGNASSGLGLQRDDVVDGVYDLLLEGANVEDVARVTPVDGLEIVPVTDALIGAEIELVSEMGRERRLEGALQSARNRYDWILIDCPPSVGLLTINALVAADSVLIPLQAEYLAMEGLGGLMKTVSEVQKWLNPHLVREGVLLTLMNRRTNLGREVEAQAREVLGDEVFKTTIPRNVRLGEAPSHGLPAVVWAKHCPGTRAYIELGDELLARHGLRHRKVVAS